MKARFYSTALICAMLAVAAPLTYADDHGDAGGHSSDHGGGMGGNMGGGMGSEHEGSMGGGHEDSSMAGGAGHDESGDMHGKKSAGDLLDHNTKLASSLEADLPEGSDLQTEAAGFKNLGQFVAAVRVSKNLGISFDDLKSRMMDGDSLGAAIHALKPQVDATQVADEAEQQAEIDLATQ